MATPGQVQVKASFFGTDDVLKQMNVIGRAGEKFGSEMTSKLGKMFGAVAIGTMAFSKLEQSISRNIATAKQVAGMAIKFNMDPSAVHSVKIAADNAGVSVRALMMSTKQLAKVAGEGMQNKGMLENWKQLGIEAEKLAIIQAKPMEFLPEIAERLAAISDEGERAAAGAMLFGRQYQQLAPLLDELGASEEAREQFLNNQNAMTDEQIKQNKEIARLQSDMEEGFNKMAAAFSPLLGFAMNFATYMANSLSSLMMMLQKADEWDKAHNKEKSGQAQLNIEREVTALGLRQAVREEKKARGEELSEEDLKEEAAIAKAGSIEDYVANQVSIAQVTAKGVADAEGRFFDTGVSGAAQRFAGGAVSYVTGMSDEDGRELVSKAQDFALPGTSVRQAAEQLKKAKAKQVGRDVGLDEKFAERIGMKNLAGMTEDDVTNVRKRLDELRSKRIGKKLERDEEGNLFYMEGGKKVAYKSGVGEMGKDALEAGQNAKAKIEGDAASPATMAMQAYARLKGKVYDAKTGKEYTKEEYDELMKGRRAGKDAIGPINFVDRKKQRAEEKKTKKIQRDLEKSERYMAEEDQSPVEKAQEAVKDIQKDMEDTQGDINEKLSDEKDLREAIAKAEKSTKEFADKQAAAEKEIAEMQKNGMKLSAEQIELIKKKHGVSKDEVKIAEGIAGSIAGSQKLLKQTEEERLVLQTKLNGEKSKEIKAIEAVRKAQEEAWLKEKKEQEDKKKDNKDFEDEKRDIKYKNMKLNGSSEQQILEEKLKDELSDYKDAAKDKEALDAEIAAKQQARIDEAYATGRDTGKAGEMTEEEKRLTKEAREKVDASRKSATGAMFNLANEKGSAAVVSDLGKIGGGRAVQFGNNNPAELIRKSNYWLEIIAKEVASEKIAEAEKGVSGALAVFTPPRPGTTP